MWKLNSSDTTVELELPAAAGLIRSNLIKITLGLTFSRGKFDTVSSAWINYSMLYWECGINGATFC